MVTHDPVADGYADQVVFRSDGQIVAEVSDPATKAVLDRLKRLDETPPTPSGTSAPAPSLTGERGRERR